MGLHTIWQLACSRVGYETQTVGAGKGKGGEATVSLRPKLRSDIPTLLPRSRSRGRGDPWGPS